MRCFTIHKQLLIAKAPVFEKMFAEACSQPTALPEDDPEAFGTFVEWLYRGTVTAVSIGDGHADVQKDSLKMLKVHFLAAKYCITELADRALTGFIEILDLQGEYPAVSLMGVCYEKSVSGSKLRQFISKLAAHFLLATEHESGDIEEDIDAYVEVFKKHGDFMKDVLRVMRFSSGVRLVDPSGDPKCTYHQHPESATCPYDEQHAA